MTALLGTLAWWEHLLGVLLVVAAASAGAGLGAWLGLRNPRRWLGLRGQKR